MSTSVKNHATKRHHMENDHSNIDCPSLQAILADQRTQLAQRLESLQATKQSLQQQHQQVYASKMVHLPKSVKHMKISEFNALYKCNLVELLLATTTSTESSSSSLPSTKPPRAASVSSVTGSTTSAGMMLETPLHNITGGGLHPNLETPSRTVRKGEVLYSQTGSPVDYGVDEGALVATVTKKPKANAAVELDLVVGNGRSISLTDNASLEDLSQSDKADALAQLRALEGQISAVFEQLKDK